MVPKKCSFNSFVLGRRSSTIKRELNRAWSSLKLEEHRNRNLPKLKSAQTEEEFNVLTERSINKMMKFLSEENIMYIKPNMEPALREHRGIFIESEKRNFFYIGMHIDPLPLYSHFYHWFDLAEIRDNPHKNPIRRAEPLYNMFDSKNEGIATAVEEILCTQVFMMTILDQGRFMDNACPKGC